MDKIAAAGLAGIKAGESLAAEGAARISRAFSPDNESSDSAVTGAIDMKNGLRQAQASAKVIKVADRLGDAILDILA